MGLGFLLGDPKRAWLYQTEPAAGANPMFWARGKLLGGSSMLNGMVYCRGNPADYDDWEANGCTGWGWGQMSEAFRSIEDHQLGERFGKGVGGPVGVTVGDHRSGLTTAIARAAEDLGTPFREDVNGLDQEGLGYCQWAIKRGRRQSAVACFLRPVLKRKNLRVVDETIARRILFDGQRATGVECRRTDGEAVTYRAREIILSAGTLESPKLLQLSGIGPKEHLAKHGVEVRLDNPHVGAHLLEHKQFNVEYRPVAGFSHNASLSGLRLLGNALRYQLLRSGPLARSLDMAGFIRSRPGLARPDAEVLVWLVTLQKGVAHVDVERSPGITVSGFLLRPKSEGSVMIGSAEPEAPPVITTNFMSHPDDERTLLDTFKYVRNLFSHPQIAPFIMDESLPGVTVQSDAQILEAIRNDGSQFHAVGTCRMGEAGRSVVGPDLRVHGVSGLRVADLSIAPSHISGNTYGPVMAMAWRAADIILADSR
jgi:choline dehydrogenase-like flavoprotein